MEISRSRGRRGVQESGARASSLVSGSCVRENDAGPAQGQRALSPDDARTCKQSVDCHSVVTGGASIARDLTLAHAALLERNAEVTAKQIIHEAGICSSCGGYLIRGLTLAVCTWCGSEIEL